MRLRHRSFHLYAWLLLALLLPALLVGALALRQPGADDPPIRLSDP